MCDHRDDRFQHARYDYGPEGPYEYRHYRDRYRGPWDGPPPPPHHFMDRPYDQDCPEHWGPPPKNIYRPSNMLGPFPRRFVSNKEFLEFLQWYRSELQKELDGVNEAIEELKEAIKESESQTQDKDK